MGAVVWRTWIVEGGASALTVALGSIEAGETKVARAAVAIIASLLER